jgi:hypothetical protein
VDEKEVHGGDRALGARRRAGAIVPGRRRSNRGHTDAVWTARRTAALNADGPEAAEIGRAALFGARGLDDERATLCADRVFASVHQAARAVLEALMANGNYEYQSDFAKRYVAQGRTEGQAHAVLGVLATRHIEVPDAVRNRILACSDRALLDRWLARAVTAATAAEVVDA